MRVYKIKDICTVEKGITAIQKCETGNYPLVVTAEHRLSSNEYQFECEAVCIPLVSSTGHGHASLKRVHYQDGKFALGNILCALYSNDETIVLTKYLYVIFLIFKDELLVPLMKGSANVSLSITDIKSIELKIPNIDIQKEIVKKYNSIENVINNLKNKAEEIKQYCDLCKKNLIDNFFSPNNNLRIDEIFDIEKGTLQSSKCVLGDYDFITASAKWKKHNIYDHNCEALVYAVGAAGSLGRVHYVKGKFIASDLCFILTEKKEVNYKLYLNYFEINRDKIVKETATGTSKLSINLTNFSKFLIPYKDIEDQDIFMKRLDYINKIEQKVVSMINDLENLTIKLIFNYLKK